MYFKNDYLFRDDKQILLDLEAVNNYVGTSEIDNKLREFTKKYPNLKLDFGLNTNKFYVCDNKGMRIIYFF